VHRKFVAKRQQFDLSDERVTLAGREQPQQGGEGEIGKREQHRPILAEQRSPESGAVVGDFERATGR
jgi:hypothetical protein